MSQDDSHKPTPQERAAQLLRKPAEHLMRPRSATEDSFEQNPLVREENLYTAAPQDRVREAVRRVVENHEQLASVAKEMQLAPASVLRWKKQYFQLLGERESESKEANAPGWQELNTRAGNDDRNLFPQEQQKFAANWQQLLEQTHASEADFRQDPWDVWLQNSDWTSWLYNEDGRFERSSLLGFIFLVLAVLSAYLLLMVDRPKYVRPNTDNPKPSQVLLLRDEYNLDKSYQVVKNFLAQDNWISRLQFVRDRDRVAPLIKEYYNHHPDISIKDVIPYMGMLGTEQISVATEIPAMKEIHYFNVVVVPVGTNVRSHLIDWESSTMYQRPNFLNFIKNQPRKPYRLWVKINKAEYFNRQFSDSKTYSCYALHFPGQSESLFGYIKRDTPDGVTLDVSTMRDEQPGVIIEARFPDKIEDPLMIEITSVVSTEWIPNISN